MLHKTVEQKMREILYWFRRSTPRTKAKYTLLLLQMCDPKLLLTAASVIRALFQRRRNNVADYNPQSETSDVCWAASTRNASFPLSRASGRENSLDNVGGEASNFEGQWKSSIQCISEMNRLFSRKAGMSKAEYVPSDPLVDLDVVKDLSSGVSKYQDFIRNLPIHLSKYILSMLDKNSLNRCALVSQHWATLVQQVKMDLSMHTFIQNHIAFLQGSYTKGIDANYANKLFIPVPKITDNGKRMRVKNQKLKLRTKNDYNLWAAYQNQETQQVQMEERNVFCGTYNIRILSDTWDRNRVIHYSGGDLVAVSSNRKIQLLDVIQVKELPIECRGHAGSVRALFLCEEENFLLSGSYDLSIRSWDLKTGACIRIFNGHQGTVTCMDLYKNRLVSGARDCQVKEVLLEGSQSQEKSKSPRRDGKKRASPVSKEASDIDGGQESSAAKSPAGDTTNEDEEKVQPGDLIKRSKKKHWQISMSPDQFLLTVNALQQAHNSGEFAYPRRPQTQVIDAWGPSISHPRKVLSFKGKSVQQAVDRLRWSNPPIDVKETSVPLEIQKLQPNVKNSLHSPRVQSTIPEPAIIRPRFAGGLKGEDQATSSTDGTVRSFSPLTSLQVIKPNRMLAPPMGVKTECVKKERPCFYTTLDPFRMNTEFMLLTVKEEKEYREAKMKEYLARKPSEVVNPGKASKAAWIRKIKGLPIDHFMKRGKTAAPELGQDMFI
uniref:CMT1A duplicated region transcript 1 n=1 Tax=Ursus maritimus TaxID=29073 RepID=A0A452TM82_URSMA